MREYDSGTWGFALVWGLRGSVFPRALALALPNAVLAMVLSFFIDPSESDYDKAKDAWTLLAGYTAVMSFVLGFRSNIAYRRWWEGGTLLQQTRGEWFNAYSSLIAFSSVDPSKELEVEAYQHMLVRLMSLLFCSALQQVSPDKDSAFEIIKLDGIDPESICFLRQTSDQVEVVLQWIQRSTILNAHSGVLTAPPPILSRAFQEISRGIVNLQNARKIADFPFPFPYAQTSIVMLIIHWAMCPIVACMMLKGPAASLLCFLLIFFLWCINYIAFDLENPFGTHDNDLPMAQFQTDWNKSLVTLLVKRAQSPPSFAFNPDEHRRMSVVLSDGCSAKKRRMSMAEHIQCFGEGGTDASKISTTPNSYSAANNASKNESTTAVLQRLVSDTSEAGCSVGPQTPAEAKLAPTASHATSASVDVEKGSITESDVVSQNGVEAKLEAPRGSLPVSAVPAPLMPRRPSNAEAILRARRSQMGASDNQSGDQALADARPLSATPFPSHTAPFSGAAEGTGEDVDIAFEQQGNHSKVSVLGPSPRSVACAASGASIRRDVKSLDQRPFAGNSVVPEI